MEDKEVMEISYLIKLVDVIRQKVHNLPRGCLAHSCGTKAQRLQEETIPEICGRNCDKEFPSGKPNK